MEREDKSLDRGGISRRDALKWAAAGAGALTVGGLGKAFAQSKVDLNIRLVAAPATVQVYSGQATNVFKYTAGVRSGSRAAVRNLPGSIVGPILRARKGQRVVVDYSNQIPEESVVHFHGLHVPEEMDGHPRFAVPAGGGYRHDFRIINRAGTYWFHAHPDMRTGFQVNRGLAGFFIVDDEDEDRLNLPRGACDVPLVIQDKRFNSQNQIMHSTGSQTGHLGDRIFVNGYPNYVHRCGTRHYRFRLLNGSNSRIYKLGWSDGRPMMVMGTAGGLLDQIIEKPYVMLGPGDRIEIWADLTGVPVGTELTMRSLAFQNGGPGSGSPPQGTQMDLFKVRVDYAEPETFDIPTAFNPIVRYNPLQAVNYENARTVAMEFMGMWTLNGRTFEMTGISDDERVKLNDLEIWEFRNDLPSAVRQPHPMHLHGPLFQINKRSIVNDEPWYDTIRDGYVDEGWHDSILLFPGERVEIITKFTDYTGLFLYHCHNLEHEDMGMMRNYQVRA